MANIVVNPQPGYNAGLSGLVSQTFKVTTPVTQDFENHCGSGIQVILDVSVKTASPTNLVLKIDGIDPVSGNVYNLLTGAAVTTVSTNVYTVALGAPATANVSANNFIPRKFRITITPTVADATNFFTASVGVNVLR